MNKLLNFDSFKVNETKFNRVKFNENEDHTIIEDFLFTFFSDYINIENNDDIDYDISNYRVEVSKNEESDDNDYENNTYYKVWDVYLSQIKIFEIKLELGGGNLELGNIIHKNHFIDLITKNWNIVCNYQKEKIKNDLL